MVNYNFTPLKWDSDFFNLKISRYDLNGAHSQDQLNEIFQAFKGDLLYLFSDTEIQLNNIEGNLILADRKVTFIKKIDPSQKNIPHPHIIPSHDLTPQLLRLAILSGHHSRFKLDVFLGEKFEELYTIWITKSIKREIASEVFIFKDQDLNTELGFITISKREKEALIGLVAVDEQSQGKKIGTLLMNAVQNWCANNNIDTLKVVTQLDNVQACNFYKKNNFSIEKTEFIYHYHKKIS